MLIVPIDLNEDLGILGWDFQWKINFNQDPYKQPQEIKFSRKETTSLHPVVHSVNRSITSTQIHKHLGMMLDSDLSYEYQIEFSLITICKTFITPQLD